MRPRGTKTGQVPAVRCPIVVMERFDTLAVLDLDRIFGEVDELLAAAEATQDALSTSLREAEAQIARTLDGTNGSCHSGGA